MTPFLDKPRSDRSQDASYDGEFDDRWVAHGGIFLGEGYFAPDKEEGGC